MGTSGKNESRNRFSIISFILESRAKYCYSKRYSARPQTTSIAKAHNPYQAAPKHSPQSFPLPAVKRRISLLLCKGWGQYHELERQRTQSTHNRVREHVCIGTKAWDGEVQNSCKMRIRARRSHLSFKIILHIF